MSPKILCVLISVMLPLSAAGQTRSWSSGGCVPVQDIADGDSLAYQAGEKFSFSIHYEWGAIDSDVGWANIVLDTLRVNGTKSWHCMVYGRTTRLYDLYFPVRENLRCLFSYHGLQPLMFTRDTREGKYKARNTYAYRRGGLAGDHIMADVFTTSDGDRSVSLPLDSCTFDLPALFYYARNMDFDTVVPDVKYPMTFAIDDDIRERRNAYDFDTDRRKESARDGDGLDRLVDGTGSHGLDFHARAVFDHAGNGAGDRRGR